MTLEGIYGVPLDVAAKALSSESRCAVERAPRRALEGALRADASPAIFEHGATVELVVPSLKDFANRTQLISRSAQSLPASDRCSSRPQRAEQWFSSSHDSWPMIERLGSDAGTMNVGASPSSRCVLSDSGSIDLMPLLREG